VERAAMKAQPPPPGFGSTLDEEALQKRIEGGDVEAIAQFVQRFKDNHLLAIQRERITFFAKLCAKHHATWIVFRLHLQNANSKIKIQSIDQLVKQLVEEWERERAAKAAQPPTQEELDKRKREKDELRDALWSKCKDIAEDPNLLSRFVKIVERYGVVSEGRAIRATYISATSRLAKNAPLSIVREGAAAAGKNFLIKNVLDFIQREDVIKLTTASPLALAYMGGDDPFSMKHKILYVPEAVSIAEREGEANPMATMFRVILSEGEIDHQVVVTRKNNTPVMSGRRPVVKGRFEDTVNVSGAVMSSAF
jgi:hypothetical protein